MIELDPAFRRAYEGKGMVYLAMNDFEKAIYYFEKYQKLIGDPLKGLSSLGHAYAAAGNTEKAKEIIEKIKEREKRDKGIPMDMDYAFVYAGMKDYENAFFHLNKTYENRVGIACLGMIFCVRYPMMKEMKSDPRFKELTTKMDL